MKPYFSVLVPVYNEERYLEECLDSLIKQTFSNIELICINDGSTDKSGDILKKYASKDARITVIERTNKGYGAAINEAFTHANGEYISIVEPDDFLDLKAYEYFYNDIQAFKDADIIKYSYWDYIDLGDTKKIRPAMISEAEWTKQSFDITECSELLLYHPSIWSGVYKKSFWENNQLSFVEAKGAGWVDNPFFIQSMCLAKKIVFLDRKVYYYRQGHAEASSNLKDCTIPMSRIMDILDFVEKEDVQDVGILTEIYKRILIYIGIVRNNQYYEHEKIEGLIEQIEKRLNADVVFSGRFNEAEECVLSEYMDPSIRNNYRKTAQMQLNELFEGQGKLWSVLEDHRLRLDGLDSKCVDIERISKSVMEDSHREWQMLDARIQKFENGMDESQIAVQEQLRELFQKQSEMQEQIIGLQNSYSFRIGRLITWLPRKFKRLFKH